MAMAATMSKTRPTGRPTFSPSFLLPDGADEEGAESEGSEAAVARSVKVGPGKDWVSWSCWSTVRERVRLAVGKPLSQADEMLRKTEP